MRPGERSSSPRRTSGTAPPAPRRRMRDPGLLPDLAGQAVQATDEDRVHGEAPRLLDHRVQQAIEGDEVEGWTWFRPAASAPRTTSTSATASWPPPGTSRARASSTSRTRRHQAGRLLHRAGLHLWATYWSPTDPSVLYVVDHQRGVDVLRVTSRGEGRQEGPAWAVPHCSLRATSRCGAARRRRARVRASAGSVASARRARCRATARGRATPAISVGATAHRSRGVWPRPVARPGRTARSTARRTPRSPTGRTSGRFRWKIRNMSAVHWPSPLTAVAARRPRRRGAW